MKEYLYDEEKDIENAIIFGKRWAVYCEKKGNKIMAQYCLDKVISLEIKLIGIKSLKKNKKKI